VPVISACRDLFPDTDSPWTLLEITQRLLCICPGMNYDRVYRAWRTLLDDRGTHANVLPCSYSRPNRFGPKAARLIARQALPRHIKARLVEMARTGSAPATGLIAPQSKKQKVKRNQNTS
jgi:hypothetical protein